MYRHILGVIADNTLFTVSNYLNLFNFSNVHRVFLNSLFLANIDFITCCIQFIFIVFRVPLTH
jgi:ABC-type spermidine/putrescine transport system permease subunit I